jgi:hypothetical protein
MFSHSFIIVLQDLGKYPGHGQENWPELTLKYSFKTRFSPTGRPGARTGPGWRKNMGRKNPVWPGDLANPVKNSVATRWVLFFTKTMSFWFFLKKKSWPGRPDDPVKTQNLSLGPDQPLGVIIFGLVRFLSKKITKPKNFKKNRNRFKPTGFSSVRFFWTKTGSNRFGSVFFWFFLFGFDSVQFFRFQSYKTKIEPNRTICLFKILIGFFSRFGFFDYFFFVFLV